jgi:ferredoxin
MFYIHPEECINCGLCLSICPVDAIVWDGEITPGMRRFEAINKDFFGDAVTGWGAPGGWDAAHTSNLDHPDVAAYPPRAKTDARAE